MEFCIWDKCNNKCIMCTNPRWPWPAKEKIQYGYDYNSLLKRLVKLIGVLDYNEPINLTGGETTLHPDFFKILDYLHENFPRNRINLYSNGRMFAYDEFTKKVLGYENIDFIIPLHGYNPATHDGVTLAKGSFLQTTKGLKSLYQNKMEHQSLEIRIVITGITYKYIDKILDHLYKNFKNINRVILIFMEIEGQAVENLKKIDLTYKKFLPYFKKLEKYIDKFKDIRFYHFPLCVVPVKFWPFVWRTLPESEISFLPVCKKCDYKKYCLGVHIGYLDNIGKNEFKQIDKNIKIENGSNFNFHPIKKIIDKK